MTIELATEEEQNPNDDVPNERGIMDFGHWEGQRFWPICKQCGGCKHAALSAKDVYCLGCDDDETYHFAELGVVYRMSER